MQLVKLGKSELNVSPLCFGGWQASGWFGTDERKFLSALKKALDCGINFIDTAEVYGDGFSETIIGNFLGKGRKEIILASKVSHRHAAPDQLRKALEASLRRLKTEYIDLYQYHWPSKKIPLAQTMAELSKLKKEGKIRSIGVSNWMEPEWQEYSSTEEIDSLQACYSLLWRSIEPTVLPLCRKDSVSILCYSPLAQGALAARYKTQEDVPPDYRKNNVMLSAENLPKVVRFVSELEKIGKLYGKSPAQTALRWLLETPGVTSAIVGCSNPNQVEENLGALGWQLKAEHYQTLSELSLPFSANLKPHDTLFGWHSKK